MKKRNFRPVPSNTPEPGYPTLGEFDQGRRNFLARLGTALLGAGTIALVGCSERPLSGERPLSVDGEQGEEDFMVYGGMPDTMRLPRDAGADLPLSADGTPGEEDFMVSGGMPDTMRLPRDAGTDQHASDTRPAQADGEVWAGGAPLPDAEIDK